MKLHPLDKKRIIKFIEEALTEAIPVISERPFVLWDPQKRAYWISVFDDDGENVAWLNWKDFVKMSLNNDLDVMESHVAHLEKLIPLLRKSIKDHS